jgi:hypothetical protein
MRIQYEILLLAFLAMSMSIGTKAQKLTEDAPPKTALKPPKGMWLSLGLGCSHLHCGCTRHACNR